MKRGEKPDIYQYLSYRKYLIDWYESMKEADSRFSYRLFARRAGVSSPSLFKEVCDGERNLTPQTLEGFVRALQLSAEEATFFTSLVHLDQARTDDEKNEAWQKVSASRRFRTARPIEGAMFAYLSNWHFPATREMALRSDFVADPDWVAERLLPRITVAQAKEALDTLFSLGMLVRENGKVRPSEVSVATAHEVAGLAAHNYHREMLDRAKEAISTVPAAERHLLGVTVAIPATLVPALKAELDAVQERLLHLCDEHAADAERVYQFNLVLFPLSEDPRPKKAGATKTPREGKP